MQYFNIQVASQLSGVASATIRAWEKRYQAVSPDRADNKHRLYSEKDIEKLALLLKLTELGQSIGKIAHHDLGELKSMYIAITQKPYEEIKLNNNSNEKIDFEKILSNFLIALRSYKLDIISHELEKAKSIVSPRDICLHILVPLFREIGHQVYKGELSIAQEHTLSALFSFHLGQMIGHHYQKKNLKEDLILISTPEGEMHEIGILASSLLCLQYGVRFIYLGTNLPAKSMAEAANALKPKAILLGVIVGHEITHKQSLEDYISELSGSLTCKTIVTVGGNLKPYVISELEKKNIPFFPSLESFDKWISNF